MYKTRYCLRKTHISKKLPQNHQYFYAPASKDYFTKIIFQCVTTVVVLENKTFFESFADIGISQGLDINLFLLILIYYK